MDRQDRDIQEMMNFLADVDGDEPAVTKTASQQRQTPSPEGVNEEIARRIREDMTEDEIQKNAASAVMSGKIMYAIIKEGNERDLPPLIHNIVKVALDQALREHGIAKAAVGTSNTIPTGTSTGTQRPDTKPFREAATDADQEGVSGFRSRTEPFFHNDCIEGVSVSGGGDPNRQAGDNPAGFNPQAGKFAAANFGFLLQKVASTRLEISGRRRQLEQVRGQLTVKQAAAEHNYLEQVEVKVAGIEEEMALYQQLKQAQEAGQPLSPEQQQQLQMLEQKLAVYMQQASGGEQGGGAPQPQDMGAGAEGQGAAPKMASTNTESPAITMLRELGLYQDEAIN